VELRREPVLFILTAAVVGWCGWSLYSDSASPIRKPTLKKGGGEVPDLRVPDLTKMPVPARPDLRRDLYGEPKDTRPLPKLEIGAGLPLPEPGAYPWVAPPPVPGPVPSVWHRFLRTSAKVEAFDFAAAPTDDGNVGGEAAAAAPPANVGPDSAAPAGAPAAAPQTGPTADELERRYDHLVPREGLEMWGKVKNQNKYDLKEDEAILFQQYDVKNDKPFGAPYTVERAKLLRVTLAKTVRNQLEQRKRKVRWVAGNEGQIREFAMQCLEWGNEEPAAFAEAERQLRKALELAPSDPANSLGLGQLLESTFRYEEAWKLYRDMTDGAFKASADAWVALASLESRLHLMADAQTHLEKAASLEPQNYRPKLVLGEFYLSGGRPERALETLEAAMRFEPQGAEGVPMRARIRRRLAEAQLALGQLDAAAETFTKSRTVAADDPGATVGLAAVALLRHKAKDAVALAGEQIARKPTAGAYVTRGLAQIELGDFLAAKNDLEAAVGLDPVRDVRPLSALAYLYLRTGHVDDAVTSLEKALLNDPGDAYARYLMGRIQRDRGQASAAESLQRASSVDLGFVDALVELGLLRTTQELTELADAERYFTKAVEGDGASAEIHGRHGLAQLQANQVRRARESFSSGLKVDKDHQLCKLGLAICDYLEDNGMGARKGLRDVADRKGALADYALDAIERIETHEKKEEWTDAFERQSLRAEWNATALQGMRATVQGGEVILEGDYPSSGEASVTRDLPAAHFRILEMDLRVPVGGASKVPNQADVSFFVKRVETRQGRQITSFEVGILRERTGAVKLRYKDANDDASPNIELPVSWPEGATLHLRIERDDQDNAPMGRILVNGEVVRADLKFPRGASGQFTLGVSAASDTGRSASVAFDNVRIVRKRDQ